MYVMLSGVLGILITLSVLMVVTVVSPIANNITGNMKDIVLTYVGFIFFDDATLTKTLATGLAISFAGAVMYPID